MLRPSHMRPIVSIVAVIGVLALVIGAAALDTSRTSGHTGRNVTMAGQPVGDQSEVQLQATAHTVADTYRGAAVEVHSPAGTLTQTAGALGLDLDQAATVQATLASTADGGAITRPAAWVRSIFSPRTAPLVFSVDPARLAVGLTPLATANHVDPTEPDIRATESGIEAVPGQPGTQVDLADLAAKLQSAAATGVTPVVVEATIVPLPPTYRDADAKAVAAKANSLTVAPLVLSVAGKTATLTTSTLRSWLTAIPGPTGLDLGTDRAKIETDLPKLIGDLGTAPRQIAFSVERDEEAKADKVVIIDGADGSRCCAADSATRIAAAITTGTKAVTLDLEPIPPDHDRAWAESMGVVEPIASFTTQHAPPVGEDRVTNIHHIADAARGMYVEPGDTFSVNGRIGKRTKEKGYVEAPVIYDSTHATDVGGGVSQFATTLFNTAFFGGLDLVDYQSHSLYISRYPYGREATISWEKPDLKFRNNTPFAVLIWPTYTDTSLTITFWSTKWVQGEQTAQSEEPKGPCTRVTTERTRTWLGDGHKETDKVYALYQPADGVSCN